jgi:ribonucleotide reductase beta subunit family protein with ferritin-like domain
MFPLGKPALWDLYKKAVGSFWTVEEVDLSKDIDGWISLSDAERHFLSMVLAFFAGSDGIVFENLNLNFCQEVNMTEANAFYAYQGFNEMIHSEMYSLLIEKYISDEVQKTLMFNAVTDVPCVKKKADWALKWLDRSAPLNERVVAFACVEGIFFSGSFCSIFWIKKRGIMPGLCFSNELISRDEGLHLEFAIAVVKELGLPSTRTVHAIVKSAVQIEKEFIIDAIPCALVGMDSEKMSEYIEYVADRILLQLGYQTIWDTPNPFPWMEHISLEGKTNFFERRVGEYSKHMDSSEVRFDQEF